MSHTLSLRHSCEFHNNIRQGGYCHKSTTIQLKVPKKTSHMAGLCRKVKGSLTLEHFTVWLVGFLTSSSTTRLYRGRDILPNFSEELCSEIECIMASIVQKRGNNGFRSRLYHALCLCLCQYLRTSVSLRVEACRSLLGDWCHFTQYDNVMSKKKDLRVCERHKKKRQHSRATYRYIIDLPLH